MDAVDLVNHFGKHLLKGNAFGALSESRSRMTATTVPKQPSCSLVRMPRMQARVLSDIPSSLFKVSLFTGDDGEVVRDR